MTDRGKHQSIHTALIDDPTFQKLTPDAKLCFYTLKLMLGAAGIDVVRAHHLALAEVTGLDSEAVRTALRDLILAGFLLIQQNVLWLKNGLRYNPALNLDNDNHRKSVRTHIEGLPALEIVNAFANMYDFDTVFHGIGDAIANTITHTITDTIGDQETETETEAEERKKKEEGTFSKENEEPKLSRGSVMQLVREVLHLNPRDREGKGQLNRSGDLLNRWIKADISLDEIARVIINARKMVDAGQISWIKPKAPFSLMAIQSPSWIDGSAQPFYNAALDHNIKDEKQTTSESLRKMTFDLPEVRTNETNE